MTTPLDTVGITDLVGGRSAQYPSDLSFEPYRREAFRKRSLPPTRSGIAMTNIAGEGTVATEGLWRREQTDWRMGAGQFSLDRKGDAQETRFLGSKGIDVFSSSFQATLLPDTQEVAGLPGAIGMAPCGAYVVAITSSTIVIYPASAGSWGAGTVASVDTVYGGSSFGTIASVTADNSYCYVASSTGIWFADVAGGATAFALYASNDSAPYSGFTLVRWANDQLIAASGPRLYAFQSRTTSAGAGTPFGSPPIVTVASATIATVSVASSGAVVAAVGTTQPHGLTGGQPITISGNATYAQVSAATLAGNVVTATTTAIHGFGVGETVTVTLLFNGVPAGRTETVQIQSVPSTTSFTYVTRKFGSKAFGTGFISGLATGTAGVGFNGNYVVKEVLSTTAFTMTVPSGSPGNGLGGSIASNFSPDMLVTHPNPSWVWSDSVGGATQVYFAGYVGGAYPHGGAIYRSDMVGSSTSSVTGMTIISSTSVAQPWNLDTPVQALPMSTDEYPTCLASYLNYIFIGTNRGIRMAQTLSVYDPTATATGDLKSGPLIPNLLQPVTYPVRAIVGDGRFVWFGWSNFDGSSTGLGKLDLATFIAGDPLAPAYASDLMVGGSGEVLCLIWNPVTNVPAFAIEGLGIFQPLASNLGGNMAVTQYVGTGYIDSGIFDYGIPDPKIAPLFSYGVRQSASSSAQATITFDPEDVNSTVQTVPAVSAGATPDVPFNTSYIRAREFKARMTLNRGSSVDATPVLRRWTMHAYPAIADGTLISAVLRLFTVGTIDGLDVEYDPDYEYVWLDTLRLNGNPVLYTEGPVSVVCVIYQIDNIPHKAKGDYRSGFEGDCVVYLKTIEPFVYTAPAT